MISFGGDEAFLAFGKALDPKTQVRDGYIHVGRASGKRKVAQNLNDQTRNQRHKLGGGYNQEPVTYYPKTPAFKDPKEYLPHLWNVAR